MKKVLLMLILAFICLHQSTFAGIENLRLKKNPRSEKHLPDFRQQDLAGQITKAFADVRKGSYAKVNDLISLGDKIFPLLEPYLEDESLSVRHKVVGIVLAVGGEKALPFIGQALNNSEPEVRLKTAESLYLRYLFALKYQKLGSSSDYKDFMPEKIAAHPQIGKSLLNNAKNGNVNIESVFLLTNFPGQETEETLKTLAAIPDDAAKDNSIQLASNIALSRLGNIAAIRELTDLAAQENLQTLKFLLKNLNEIDSKEIIYALTKTLDNKTLIVKGNPEGKIHERTKSGVWIDYPIARRICDLAVNSFVERLDLKINFPLHNGIYTQPQIYRIRSQLKDINSIIIPIPYVLIK